MRIGVNTLFCIPNEVGGSETYLRETIRALAHVAVDHELILFTQRDNDDGLRALLANDSNTRFHCMNFSATRRSERILREQLQLPFAARRKRIDVLWSPGYTAPLHVDCPQVVSILDMQYRSHPEDLSFLARWVTHVLVQAAARRAARLIAISEFSKTEILHHTRARPENIAVTYLAASPCLSEAAIDPMPGIPRPYVLCIANTYPHKNVHSLARAFGLVQPSVPHHLVIVGKARRGESLLRDALQGCDRRRIHRRERVTYAELRSLYRYADLFAFPSLYEGFGLPVLEAMMAGTPVLACPRGAIPEIAGETAFYFDPEDPKSLPAALARLLRSPAERCSLRNEAQSRGMQFSWEETAKQTLAALYSAAYGPS